MLTSKTMTGHRPQPSLARLAHACWAAVLTLSCCASLLAQDDRTARALVELVGRDAGLIVEVNGLTEQFPVAAASPVLSRLHELELYRRWLASDDYEKLLETRDQLESLLDAESLGQLVRDLFGESVVVAAYRSGQSEPAGILLTQARSTDVLARTVSAWNAAESAELETRQHAGLGYFRRTVPADDAPAAGPKTQYYATLGRTFALSDSESAVQRTIELAAAGDAAASLAGEATYQTARRSLAEGTLASAWVNPRVWEDDSEGDNSLTSLEAAGLSRDVESVITGLRLNGGIVLEAVVHLAEAPTHDTWSEFVEQAGGAPGFLSRAPQTALVVLAGRTDFTRTERLVAAQLPEENRRQWEMLKQLSPLLAIDLVNDVLPVLGEQWVLLILPRDEPRPQAPVDAVFAFELAAGPAAGERVPGRDRLERGMATAWDRLARFLSQGGSLPDVAVQTDSTGDGEIHWVAGLGPYAPTCAVSEDALVFASSPDAARAWLNLEADDQLGNHPAFSEWHRLYLADRNPVLFINVEAARSFVREHREILAQRAADDGKLSAAGAAERLDRFDDLLKLVDAAFAAVELNERSIRVVVGGLVEPADTSDEER